MNGAYYSWNDLFVKLVFPLTLIVEIRFTPVTIGHIPNKKMLR